MIEVEVTQTVTREMIRDALTHAFENESSYWAQNIEVVSRGEGDFKDGDEGYMRATWVPLTPGGVVRIQDADEPVEEYCDETGHYLLTHDKIVRGVKLMSSCREGRIPEHWNYFLNGDSDGYSGDLFLQFCLFGECLFS